MVHVTQPQDHPEKGLLYPAVQSFNSKSTLLLSLPVFFAKSKTLSQRIDVHLFRGGVHVIREGRKLVYEFPTTIVIIEEAFGLMLRFENFTAVNDPAAVYYPLFVRATPFEQRHTSKPS